MSSFPYPDLLTNSDGPTPELRETHISWVILTQEHAFKLKKPVNFGFLDYTTLEKRHYYCKQELRLNRRYCSRIYLDVVAVTATDNGHQWNGAGPVVDYAVKMSRLPEELMLSHLLASGQVYLPPRIAELGSHIADLHQQTEACHDQRDAQRVTTNWRDNLHQLRPFAQGSCLWPHSWQALYDWGEAFLHQYQPLLHRRQQQNKVKDLHGDLHSSNICMTDDICCYDAIEFNTEFRRSDMLAELAFLAMDLDERGHPELRRTLVRSYRQKTAADVWDPRLWPFYVAYRALVRAKVNALLGSQEQGKQAIKACHQARNYVQTALAAICPQHMLVTFGLMGTGKSTLARRLARHLNAVWLRSDIIRKELFAASSHRGDNWHGGIYTQAHTEATYRELLRRAEAWLQQGYSVIIDATCSHVWQRQWISNSHRHLQVSLLWVWCRCPDDLALQRLQQRWRRGTDPSDGRSSLFTAQKKDWQPPYELAEPWLMVDTRQQYDYNIQRVLPTCFNKAFSYDEEL